MNMIIETPNIKAREQLLDFVKEKVGKLELLAEKIVDCRVYLKVDKSHTRENKFCEIKLAIPGSDLFASAQSSNFEEAVQQAIAAMKHQIERSRDAKKRRLHEKLL